MGFNTRNTAILKLDISESPNTFMGVGGTERVPDGNKNPLSNQPEIFHTLMV